MSRNAQSEAAAMACLDAFMTAFNSRDITAFEQTFNFPSIRLASNTMRIINKGDQTPATFDHASLKEWDRSAWEKARDHPFRRRQGAYRHPVHPLPEGRQRHRRVRLHLCGHLRGRPLGDQGPLQLRPLRRSGAQDLGA